MTYWDKLRQMADQMRTDGYEIDFGVGANGTDTLMEVAAYLDRQDRKAKRATREEAMRDAFARLGPMA